MIGSISIKQTLFMNAESCIADSDGKLITLIEASTIKLLFLYISELNFNIINIR